MKPSTKHQAKGKLHEIKGKVKEAAGVLTGNPDLEQEGKVENALGTAQKKVGQIEEVLGK